MKKNRFFFDFRFEKNEIVAIVGSSGSGKSTLLNVISGVDTYEDGEMYFKGSETSYFNQDDMDTYRKNNVAFIFQNYNIIDSYTVLDNVIAPMLLKNINYQVSKELLFNYKKLNITDSEFIVLIYLINQMKYDYT